MSIDRRVLAPWFRRHPRPALGLAVLLFAGVFVLRPAADGAEDAVTLLYALPVSLLAVTFGRRGGLLGAVIACALLGAWALTSADDSLGDVGWAVRAAAMSLLGGLLGDAVDRGRDRERLLAQLDELRHRQELARLRQREAVEIHDSIVQGLAASKWMLECGRTDDGLETLTETIHRAEDLVAELLADVEDARVVQPVQPVARAVTP